MRAGDLRNRIQVQAREQVPGPTGQPSTKWVTKHTLWASIRHPSGMETIRQGIEITNVNASIRIRYREDITAGMRVLHHDRVYDIKAVLPDMQSREHLDLTCKTGANDG